MAAVCAAAWLGGASAPADDATTRPAPTTAASAKPASEPGTAESARPTTTEPITTITGTAGNLLRKWWADGTAAGNVGDFYDNRDRGHSPLNLKSYPQLQTISYTEEQRRQRLDWGLQTTVLRGVVLGNSSTAASFPGGSNMSLCYAHPRGLPFLYTAYRRNNLYIYPCHHDHDPGHNGVGGYGDVYLTNTPYLISSQGSSHTDQACLRAMALTLAAFQPEVKARLISAGLLMPTLQMILRTTNNHLANPQEDYLTGQAHPTVFEGGWVNDLKMVQLAHEILPENIPPMIQLKVVAETEQKSGRDYFGPGVEQFADTPAAIARIWRGLGRWRELSVSAEASFDVNHRPLTYHWVVLRGDPRLVTIKPANPAGSVAEIKVGYQTRRPVSEGSKLESNRVDIGVFVHNGAYYSAPGFVTFFFLDDESRDYDDADRPREIAYGLGETILTVTNWSAALDLFRSGSDTLGARLLKKLYTAEQIVALQEVARDYAAPASVVEAAREKQNLAQAEQKKAGAGGDSGQKARQKADATVAEAIKALKAATAAADDVLDKKRDALAALGGSARGAVDAGLKAMRDNGTFYAENAAEIQAMLTGSDVARKKAFAAARQDLVAFGLLKPGPEGSFELQPIRPAIAAQARPADRLTRYEQCLLGRFHGALISNVLLPGVIKGVWKRNFVDQRVDTTNAWRDVYHYDDAGRLTGWTRYDGKRVLPFDPDGQATSDTPAVPAETPPAKLAE